jgi:hypothetical protein
MTEQTTTKHTNEQDNTSRPGMIETIIHLGSATTNLAIDQVGNAFTALVHPVEAIEHVKETLLNLSDAMNSSADSSRTGASAGRSREQPASDFRGASNGMEYVSDRHAQTPFVDVRTPGATPAERVRATKINHRKT